MDLDSLHKEVMKLRQFKERVEANMEHLLVPVEDDDAPEGDAAEPWSLRIDALESRLAALEERMTAIEAANVSAASASSDGGAPSAPAATVAEPASPDAPATTLDDASDADLVRNGKA